MLGSLPLPATPSPAVGRSRPLPSYPPPRLRPSNGHSPQPAKDTDSTATSIKTFAASAARRTDSRARCVRSLARPLAHRDPAVARTEVRHRTPLTPFSFLSSCMVSSDACFLPQALQTMPGVLDRSIGLPSLRARSRARRSASSPCSSHSAVTPAFAYPSPSRAGARGSYPYPYPSPSRAGGVAT